MRIFEDKNGHLKEMDYPGFKKEKELHHIVDDNLDLLFPGLSFVERECEVGSKKLDTLAFDHNNREFVIIEYKREKGMEMANQVAVYKEMVKKNPDTCVLALRDNLGSPLKKKDIKWKNTRMIFVKPDFSKQEIEILNTESLVDLCAVRKYPGGLIVHHLGTEYKSRSRQRKPKNTEPRLPPTGRRRRSPEGQTNQYLEADWLDGKYLGPKIPESTRSLYFDLKQAILSTFPGIEYVQQKLYAKFYLEGGKTICTVACTKDKLDLVYATNDMGLLPLNDFVEDVSDVGHHGPGKHRSRLRHKRDISRALVYVGIRYSRLSGKKPDPAPPTNKPAGKPGQYSEDDWLDGKQGTPAVPQQTRDLYFELKGAILDRFGRVEHKQKSKHAGFYIKGSANQVCSVICRKSLIYLMYGTKKKGLLPADDFITDVSNTGHWGAGDYRSTITAASDIQRALDYVALVYRDRTAT